MNELSKKYQVYYPPRPTGSDGFFDLSSKIRDRMRHLQPLILDQRSC